MKAAAKPEVRVDHVPAKHDLSPAFARLERMRYRWYKSTHLPCYWKVALEAFNEGYHVFGTPPSSQEIPY